MDKEQLIAKYIQNKLSEAEVAEVERLLDSDSEFREQLEFELQVKKAFYKREHNEKKEFLKSIESNVATKDTEFKWYLVAASIVIMIMAGVYWNGQTKNPQKLFDSYYTVASNTSHPIVRDNSGSNEITKAFIAYEREDYKLAQKLFADVYKNANNSELLFYQGICYLETGKTNKAIEVLLKHVAFNDKLKNKGTWYLALAFLKSNEKDKAKVFLKQITESSTNYNYSKAKDLLSKL